MSFKLKPLIAYLLIVVGLIGILFLIIVRFQNPTLTETQLLIQYWEFYLITCILSLTGIFILEKESDD